MRITRIISLLMLACYFKACGQIGNHEHKEIEFMDTNIIQDKTVRQAFEAWQEADTELWLSLFTGDALLFDDGKPRDFMKFSTEAIGHERFTSIDKIEDHGMSIYGYFHSDTWGDFRTYFKFHIDINGKVYQLDIGQVNY